jgi:hypothetical protein
VNSRVFKTDVANSSEECMMHGVCMRGKRW